MQKTDIGSCWLWLAYREPKMGYGKFVWQNDEGKTEQYAHRFAFYEHYGYLPTPPQTIDHKCRNASCVNPYHLREASPIEQTENSNNQCAINKAKTHCKHGHVLKDENLFVYKDGRRECKTCRLEHQRKYNRYQGMLPTKQRTHCPYGHEYNLENTLYIKRPTRNTIERQCKMCKKIRRQQ